MRRVWTRAFGVLPLVIVVAVAAALSGGTQARAATAAVSSGECSFNPTVICQSSDSSVALDVTYTGASSCSFTWHVTWGDGKATNVINNNPADGSSVLANHTYAKPGTYKIAGAGTVTAGNCTTAALTGLFSLVEPMVALGDSYSSV